MKFLRMQSKSPLLAGCFMLVITILMLPAAARRVAGEEPPVFAITNAKVIPVSAPTIEKGTVVIRDGIIEAVGADVPIPGDARVIDAAGLVLYPGLIDGLTDTGLEEAQTASQTPAPSRVPGPPAPAPAAPQQQPDLSPDERQGVTPYRQAADLLNPGSKKIESSRAAGITTALVAPRGGTFTGQCSLINLAGAEAGGMILKTPVAFNISLASSRGFGSGYPSSPMGVLALVRQTLLDAQRYSKAWSIYNANPGARRPEHSRALEALQPLMRQQVPAIFPADSPTEIQRVLDLAAAFKISVILSSGMEAGKIASVLRERNVPVLLSVKYPEREKDADPEGREELTALRRRVEAPACAAALAKAGVKFAFQSGDMANPKDFIRNVARAVEAGLDRDIAVRALTLTPAEIFGVADRVGSIEKNKTANLILVTGDIFDADTRVKYVFVDGRMFDITEPDTRRERDAEPSGPPDPGSSRGLHAPQD